MCPGFRIRRDPFGVPRDPQGDPPGNPEEPWGGDAPRVPADRHELFINLFKASEEQQYLTAVSVYIYIYIHVYVHIYIYIYVCMDIHAYKI